MRKFKIKNEDNDNIYVKEEQNSNITIEMLIDKLKEYDEICCSYETCEECKCYKKCGELLNDPNSLIGEINTLLKIIEEE